MSRLNDRYFISNAILRDPNFPKAAWSDDETIVTVAHGSPPDAAKPMARGRAGRYHTRNEKPHYVALETEPVNRLALAFQAFFKVLFDEALARGVAEALNPPPPAPPVPPEPVRHDLRVLALLQRDGRLVDFLMESIDDYDDAQVGSAARDIHARCRKTVQDHFRIEPIGGAEGSKASVPVGYDAAAIRLTGNVGGEGPWSGTVSHPGWQVVEVRVPEVPGAYSEAPVLQPLEVEVG